MEVEGSSCWRLLEFYSGIGAMRYSLMRAGVRGRVVEAFDINNIANDVYEHNFGHRPFQGNIQTLRPSDLDKYAAHAWLLSPPCQPYTRQGLQKDSADARAISFIKLLENIANMVQPPLMLFVENVVGFETSKTHEHMLEALARIGFITQEYILSPLQFGIPYSRPRYFCLAKREPLSFKNPFSNNLILWTPPFTLSEETKLTDNPDDSCSGAACQSIINFLDTQSFMGKQQECSGEVASLLDGNFNIDLIYNQHLFCPNFQDFDIDNALEKNESGDCVNTWDTYSVPSSLIERWSNAMDIVFPKSKRCCCFTKSYYRYVKGTGSLLATCGDINESLQALSLKDLHLRFFTPREVANLHSFPPDFHFPPHVSLRQRYALLGNSMSIAVVAPLLQHLFSEPIQILKMPIYEGKLADL